MAVLSACEPPNETCAEPTERHGEHSEPTGAICPPDNALTYENFGKPFMDQYCVRCHRSELVSEDERMCAPLGYDFDTLMGILDVAAQVGSHAAAGPDSINELMPEDDPKPTLEEREQLGQWLACELADSG